MIMDLKPNGGTAGILPSTTVARVLETWPQAIELFLKYNTDCVGCPVAPYCTLEEAAQHYDLELPLLLKELACLAMEKAVTPV
ncbi:MAG: DUF1858 domain-containing protein [Chloroflexi bacterium]|nr:DUF1858 domain-containing protein [Chloroflexota bacterium]